MRVAVIVYHKNIGKVYPASWIKKFYESIKLQTFKDFDIFEMNYGDGHERIFLSNEGHQIYYGRVKQKTFANAMNSLLEMVSGYDYVANTNVDDWYSEDRLEKQLEAAKKYRLDIISSNFNLIGEDGLTKHKHQFHELDIEQELARDHNIICHPVVMYSKNFLERNRYIPGEIPFEDMKLWQRTIPFYRFKVLEDVLCYHRLHGQSVGHQLKEV